MEYTTMKDFDRKFAFNCVNDGKPFRAGDIPKLPPKASKIIAQLSKKLGASPDINPNTPDGAILISEMLIDMVFLTLRRMDKSVTKDSIEDDEDFDEVRDLFQVIQERNPAFFPEQEIAKAKAKEEEDKDPTTDASKPAENARASNEK